LPSTPDAVAPLEHLADSALREGQAISEPALHINVAEGRAQRFGHVFSSSRQRVDGCHSLAIRVEWQLDLARQRRV